MQTNLSVTDVGTERIGSWHVVKKGGNESKEFGYV